MQSKAATVEQYIAELPEERKEAMIELRKIIKKNLPKGFEEGMSYGMIGYYVPHSIYPNGYHCNPEQPLPFACLASQKNFIAFYHMCVYGDTKLSKWFVDEYAKLNIGKPDMGKSCIRFKNMSKIPYRLIGELCAKVTVKQWIDKYEKVLQR
ncbi:DUF1801 domain-containing protein [Ferruginibacter profundus]